MMIQVGDFGAFPHPDESLRNSRFVREDPTELDFSKYVHADGELAAQISRFKQRFLAPIRFIRGNHEDFGWLSSVTEADRDADETVIDKFGLIHYVRDGTILQADGVRIAFLGGIETDPTDDRSYDTDAFERIRGSRPGDIDILVTHDAPFGVGTDFHGKPQGSKRMTELIERIRPKLLFSGHYHQQIGPLAFGETTYFGLNVLLPPRRDSRRKEPTERIQSGSMAVLDTNGMCAQFVTEERLLGIARDFDFMQGQ